MKKYVFLLVSLFITIAIHAQAKHLKFMGIPLNGTITQFQAKLATKGIAPNNRINQQIPVGGRIFNGTFSGEKASIFVYYNTKSKIVYRAKAVIDYSDSEMVKDKLEYYKELLTRKYTNRADENFEKDGYPAYTLYIGDDEGDFLGTISLYISTYDYEYCLHIDYEDDINTGLNTSENMDDL